LAGEGRDLGAPISKAMSQAKIDIVDRAHHVASQFGRIGCGQIQRKTVQDLRERLDRYF